MEEARVTRGSFHSTIHSECVCFPFFLSLVSSSVSSFPSDCERKLLRARAEPEVAAGAGYTWRAAETENIRV